jgi:hypothetical protein
MNAVSPEMAVDIPALFDRLIAVAEEEVAALGLPPCASAAALLTAAINATTKHESYEFAARTMAEVLPSLTLLSHLARGEVPGTQGGAA